MENHTEESLRPCIIKQRVTDSGIETTAYDAETGQKYGGQWEGTFRSAPGRPAGRFGEDKPEFFRIYCANWADIIDKKRLSFVEVGVFMSLLRFVDWQSNWLVHPKSRRNLNASEIADLLKADRSSMCEHLKRLHDKGMLAAVSTGKGSENHYLLNSHVVFKGKRIQNLNEHDRFCKDTYPYKPVRPIKYAEVQRDCVS
jgi:hypothetical protein